MTSLLVIACLVSTVTLLSIGVGEVLNGRRLIGTAFMIGSLISAGGAVLVAIWDAAQ